MPKYSDAQITRMYRNARTPEERRTLGLVMQARGLAGHAPSLRSDVLSAELRTAKTRAERRAAVDRFMSSQRSPEESRFISWLASPGHETRSIGEASSPLVPASFSASVIHYMREYSALMGAFEHWETDHGEAYNRAAYSMFTSAASASENTAFTEGPNPTIANQAWPQASTYAASFTASNQLIADAFRVTNARPSGQPFGSPSSGTSGVARPAPFMNPEPTPALDALVASALGESLGRAIAPVASTALYAAINAQGATSGGNGGFLSLAAATPVTFGTGAASTELLANTVHLDTAAQMIAGIDEAYLEAPDCAFFMSRAQWTGIVRQVSGTDKKVQINPSDESRSLWGFPVVLTSQTSSATASTVAGPVFGSLSNAMTLRTVAGSLDVLRSSEKYAEYLRTYYRSHLRADVAARDARAVVGVKYAAT